MDTNLVLVSGAVVFKEGRGKRRWFIVMQGEEDGWEIPKVFVRKGESSVRAALRMMGEQGGMTTQVLEEAGRAGGVTTVNEKILPQRHLYYLMVLLSETSEAIGFDKFQWLEYAKAVRALSSKRERVMLRQARKELRKWKKRQVELEKQA
ncbi:NUDIX domain-containing protein [Patescibacteria group bacterium]|nr:NUDIX domain-containing protein [Patescibacteria group bacterium]